MARNFAVIAIRPERRGDHPGREKAFLIYDCFNDKSQAGDYITRKSFQYPPGTTFIVTTAAAARRRLDDENTERAEPR